jgi:hypothetical protein
MLHAYLRLMLFIAGLIGAGILAAFAFTAAAIVVFVTLVILAITGRRPNVSWTMQRRSTQYTEDQPRREPLTIDHDPNDLPPEKR